MDQRVHLSAGGLAFYGVSRAGLATAVRVQQLGILCDAGACDGELISPSAVLISHEHPDHLSALPQILTMRRLLGHPELLVCVPEYSRALLSSFLEAGQAAGAYARWQYRVVGLEPGQSVALGRGRRALAFSVDHRVPALGYVIYETRKKLLPEFAGVPGAELASLKRAGRVIAHEVEVPVLAVSGDTTAGGLCGHPDVARARVLLAECTFFGPEDLQRAAATQHTHFEELAPLLAGFQNEAVVLYHVSLRHSLAEVKATMEGRLSPDVFSKVQVLL